MSLFVLDTDALSLWQRNPVIAAQLAAHATDQIAITIITVQEQLDGWHSRLPRAKTPEETSDLYRRLADTVRFLSRVPILLFTVAAIDRYVHLQKQKLNIGKMDLRIASIALEHHATVVTRNTRDFSRIPGLIIEDWSM
jgi:tRNA(fMet)-specific endonuclease VapC